MRALASFVLICGLLLSLDPTSLCAQPESEAYSNSYLLRSVGARTLGLCGAYTSSVNEANTMFCNAGALAMQPENVQLSTMYSALSFGRSQNTLAVTKNLGSSVGMGLSFNVLTNPGFQRYNAAGTALGMATFQQYAAGIGFGTMLSSMGIGVVAKYVVNNVAASGLKAQGYSIDIGTKMPFSRYFNFGLAVQNIGSVQWNNASSTTESLPWIIRSGLSTEIPLGSEDIIQRSTTLGESDTIHVPSARYVLIALEADYARSAACASVNLASEYAISELFWLRGGFGLLGDNFGTAEFSALHVYSLGLSYRLHAPELPVQLQIDYALAHDYVSANGLGHHFSLTVGF